MQELKTIDDWDSATPQERMDFVVKARAQVRERRTKEKAPNLLKVERPPRIKRKRVAKQRKTTNLPSTPSVTSKAFLESFEWRRLRMQALKLHGARCQCCGASAKTGAVIHVDHIKPRKLFPELALSLSNLQVLCHECNHGKGNWDQTDWR